MTTELYRNPTDISTLGSARAGSRLGKETNTSLSQPEQFKGKFGTPIVVPQQDGQESQTLWINEATFVGNFPENQGIGEIIKNLGPSQRLATPEEAPFIYNKFPHLSKGNPTYFADKDGVYLSTQSFIKAPKLTPPYIIAEPSMTKIDPETTDLNRHNPGHRVLLVGVPNPKI